MGEREEQFRSAFEYAPIGKALLTVINDVLDFSKIEAGKVELDPVPFALRAGLADLLKPFAFRASDKRLSLTCTVAADVPDDLVGDLAGADGPRDEGGPRALPGRRHGRLPHQAD